MLIPISEGGGEDNFIPCFSYQISWKGQERTEILYLLLDWSEFHYVKEKRFNRYVRFSDALQQGASQFEQQAGKLKRKFWLQNLKVRTNSPKIWQN